MSAVGLLFRDALRRDKTRLLCALFGMSAAAALLTWTLGLAATTWWQGRPLSEQMGRPFDCWVSTGLASAAAPKGSGMQTLAQGAPLKQIPAAVAEAVRACPDVKSVLATTVSRCQFDWRPDGRPLQGPGAGGGLSPVRDFPACPYVEGLAEGRWPRADAAEPEMAVSQRVFGRGGAGTLPPLGTKVTVVTPSGGVEATLCGYLAESVRPVAGFPTVFASDGLAAAARPSRTEGACNLMLVTLKPGRTTAALAEAVRTAAPGNDAAKLVTRGDLLRQLRSDAVESLSRQVPLLVILACAATLCMLVNALCVGLEQNRRRYAHLRALGMTAGQLAGLIVREGFFLSASGGALGFLAGWGLLAGYVASKPQLFPDGLRLGWSTPLGVLGLLALACALALVGPLRRAARLRPWEWRASPETWRPAHPFRALLLAVALMLPAMATPLLFKTSPALRSGWFLCLGAPLAVWGLLRAARPVLWAAEGVLARPLGALLGLRPELLRGVLLRSARRNARMALTLTAGLGAFFAIHIWGASLTDPFIPSADLPDAIVSLLPDGMSPEGAAETVAAVDEAVLTPFFAEQYRLQDEDFEAVERRTGLRPKQNNILLVGTEGDEGVVISAMMARQCGLRPGDTLRIQRQERDGAVKTLPLTITGVRQVNWHLFTARARLRARNGAPFGTLGPVFVSADAFRAWDPGRSDRQRFFWAQLAPSQADDTALYSLSDRLEAAVQAAVNRDAAARPYVARFRPGPAAPGGSSRPAAAPRPAAPANVIVHLRDEISEGTLAHSAQLLGDLARIPLWSLLILCTGFVSLLAAHVRLQAGELRTLHAVGMTRGQMGRFLFAQALMLGAAAALLSLLFGAAVGWGFTGLTLAWMPFGGLPAVLVFPLGPLAQGLAALFAATLLVTPLPIALLVRQLLKGTARTE